jgi:pilus assembly protein Flp/PilA
MKNIILNFVREEDGAALVEYGLALLVVILVGVAALQTVATDTTTLFTGAGTATTAAAALVP